MLARVVGAYVVGFVVALHHFHRRAAIGAEIRCRHVPTDEIALGIICASVERLACLRNAFAHVAAALGAFADNLHYAFNIFALWIVGTSKERSV